MKSFFYDHSFETISNKFSEWGEPAFRAKQVWQLIYKNGIFNPAQFPSIPRSLRTRLEESFNFHPVIEERKVESDNKQTSKYVLRLADNSRIEAVLMRYTERSTACISTQAGCAMNCAFCATGQMGFTRNLTSGEIAGQVFFFADALKKENKKLTNLVLMGMGEPFQNYDAVMNALNLINDPAGFQFGERRITISTVGIIPKIKVFTDAKRQINLSVSLHAPTNELRDQIIPINKKYPLEALIQACSDYTKFTRRRITFEYALISGFNDTPEQAAQLSKLLKGMLCHVNLIPLNPTDRFAQRGSEREKSKAFQDILTGAGIPCSIRLSRGVEIGAGCGQLLIQS